MAVIAIEEHFTSPELRKLIAPREGPIQAMLDSGLRERRSVWFG